MYCSDDPWYFRTQSKCNNSFGKTWTFEICNQSLWATLRKEQLEKLKKFIRFKKTIAIKISWPELKVSSTWSDWPRLFWGSKAFQVEWTFLTKPNQIRLVTKPNQISDWTRSDGVSDCSVSWRRFYIQLDRSPSPQIGHTYILTQLRFISLTHLHSYHLGSGQQDLQETGCWILKEYLRYLGGKLL